VLFVRMPTGFLPEEDQGAINVQVLLPPGSTMERTRAVLEKVGQYFTRRRGGGGRVGDDDLGVLASAGAGRTRASRSSACGRGTSARILS
jgi:multidrug efflux pump subunit AcrB